MTIEQAKLLNVGDICKDLSQSALLERDVYCKVGEITESDITFVKYDDTFHAGYPWTILFDSGSHHLESFEKFEA